MVNKMALMNIDIHIKLVSIYLFVKHNREHCDSKKRVCEMEEAVVEVEAILEEIEGLLFVGQSHSVTNRRKIVGSNTRDSKKPPPSFYICFV